MRPRREFGAGISLSLSDLERNFRRLRGFAGCDEDDGMGSEEEWFEAAKGWEMIGRPLARRESD